VVTFTTQYNGAATNAWRVPTNFFIGNATASTTASGGAFAYQVLSSTQTITGGPTTSNLTAQTNGFPTAMIAAFKQAPLATNNFKNLPVMGVGR